MELIFKKLKDMKKTILIVLIYLSGSVVCYNYAKFNIKEGNPNTEWTIRNRNVALILSSASWLSVITMGIVHFERNLDLDKKASW